MFPRRGYHDQACDDRAQSIQSLRHNQLAQSVDRDSRRYSALKTRLQMIAQCDRPPPPARRYDPQTWVAFCTIITIAMLAIISARYNNDYFVLWLFAIIGLAFSLSQRFKRSEMRTITAMTLVAEGICGECGFSLEGLTPEDDHCIVCPECGHAWNAHRITRPYRDPCEIIDKPKRDPRPDIRAGIRLRDPRRWCTDDCARCVHTPDRRLSEMLPSERETLGYAFHQLRNTISRLSRAHRVISLLMALSISTALLIRLGIPEFHESAWRGVLVIILLSAPIVIAFVLCAMATWIRPHHIVHLLTSRGYCGSCVNDLSRTAPNANGVRVCSRCRSSWLDERFPPAIEQKAADS